MGLLDQIELEHVRLHGARAEPVVARLRLSSLLTSASLQPAAMPPQAVLVVRHMDDPLPGRIAPGLKAAASTSFAWERAAQNRLGELYARAARPARGAVPWGAEAVLFADYSELLACLASEASRLAASGWWWQSIRRRFPLRLPGSWAGVWEQHPRYVPAALERLVEYGQAAAVLERIAPVQAWRLLRVMAEAFSLFWPAIQESYTAIIRIPPEPRPRLPDAGAASSLRGLGPPPSPQTDSDTSKPETAPDGASSWQSGWGTTGHTASPAPWEPYIPLETLPRALGIERTALLGVAMLLRRAPQAAFSSAFVPRFTAWLAAEVHATGREDEYDNRRPGLHSPEVVTPPASTTAAQSSVHARPSGPAAGQAGQAAHSGGESAEALSEPVPGPVTASRAGPPAAPDPAERRTELSGGVLTRSGGIFFLVHLLRQADLLREFDTGLGGWAIVELLARCLLRPRFLSLADDPIWDALAELDGREPDVPAGAGFQPQPAYAAPESWLRRLPPALGLVRFRPRGLEIWRPEGFLLLDSSRADLSYEGCQPLTRHARSAFRGRTSADPAGVTASPELRRFLRFVLAYARWRIGSTLPDGWPHALLRKARLYLTPTHLDLVMNMNQVSVPVRIAGLDTDPGWVPELGHVIRFHYTGEGYGDA